MRQLFFALAALLALHSSPSAAQTKCGQFEKEWSVCAEDADCAPAHDACGWPASYHKDFVENAEKYNRCLAPMIECDTPKERPRNEAAVCKDGVCGLPEE